MRQVGIAGSHGRWWVQITEFGFSHTYGPFRWLWMARLVRRWHER